MQILSLLGFPHQQQQQLKNTFFLSFKPNPGFGDMVSFSATKPLCINLVVFVKQQVSTPLARSLCPVVPVPADILFSHWQGRELCTVDISVTLAKEKANSKTVQNHPPNHPI